MSDINVGDRVKHIRSALVDVCAIDGNKLWVKDPHGNHWTTTVSLLTRIEPVVLTPKYSVGQTVNCIGQGKVQVTGVEVGYHIEKWGGLWPESLLEPVPTPCPTCKGSGKSSE